MPSAIVAAFGVHISGSPRASDSGNGAQASTWTPITRTSGRALLTTPAMPEISPPPPTGTITVWSSGTSSSSSSPSVAWPRITSGSSNGCTNPAPVSAARSSAAATQSSTVSPPSSTVPPNACTAATFATGASRGMNTSHGIPCARAA